MHLPAIRPNSIQIWLDWLCYLAGKYEFHLNCLEYLVYITLIKVETVSASSEQNPHSIEERYLFDYVLKGPFRPLCIH